MKNLSELRDVSPIVEKQENYLSQILDDSDFNKLIELKEELKDTWTKKQIFRTETEMRYSVLNDGKFPTKASKYWQCVREQNVFFETLMSLSFEYRTNEVEIKKLIRKIENEFDDLEKELLQIELEQRIYSRSNMELVAKDRIRELNEWSKIKNELDDGSFDTQNVNTHQKESLEKQLEFRLNSLGQTASPAEINNVLGPLSTMKKEEFNKMLNESKIESIDLSIDSKFNIAQKNYEGEIKL